MDQIWNFNNGSAFFIETPNLWKGFIAASTSQFAKVKYRINLNMSRHSSISKGWKVFTTLSYWTLGEKQLLGAISWCWWHRLSRSVRLGNGVSAVGRCAIQPQRIEGNIVIRIATGAAHTVPRPPKRVRHPGIRDTVSDHLPWRDVKFRWFRWCESIFSSETNLTF